MNFTLERVEKITRWTDDNRKKETTRLECAVAAIGFLTDPYGFGEMCCLQAQINACFKSHGVSTEIGNQIPSEMYVAYPSLKIMIHRTRLQVLDACFNPDRSTIWHLLSKNTMLLFLERPRRDVEEPGHVFALKPADVMPRDFRRKMRRLKGTHAFVDTGRNPMFGITSTSKVIEYTDMLSSGGRIDLGILEVSLRGR